MGTYSHHLYRLPWSCFTQTWTGWRHTTSWRHRHRRYRTKTKNWDNSGSGCNRLPVLLSQCKSSGSFGNSGRTSKHVKSHWTSLQSNQTETPNNNTHCYGKLTRFVQKHLKLTLLKLCYLDFQCQIAILCLSTYLNMHTVCVPIKPRLMFYHKTLHKLLKHELLICHSN